MKFITIVGIVASLFTAISMTPQLIKLFREKKAESVSILMLLVLFSGLCLWIWYGSLINDWIIIISNSLSALINALTIFLTIRYKRSTK